MMKKALSIAALCGLALGLNGCGDDDDGGRVAAPAVSKPSINSISPTSAFLGRATRVTISGFDTDWSSVSLGDIDFGAGIVVDGVTVASPTALLVTIMVGSTAVVGPRDVSISSEGSQQVFSQAFSVTSPLEVVEVRGTAAQGSIISVTIENRDLLHPFAVQTPAASANQADFGEGIRAEITSAVELQMTLRLWVDVHAAAGLRDLVVAGGLSAPVEYHLPGAVKIAVRNAIALKANLPTTVSLSSNEDTQLLSYTPSAFPSVMTAWTESDSNWGHAFYMLPASGSFDHIVDEPDMYTMQWPVQWWVDDSGPFYFVLYNVTGEGGYDIELTVHAPYESVDDHRSCATARAMEDGDFVGGLILRDPSDEEWFTITTTAGDADKLLRVDTRTQPNFVFGTDTVIEIYEGACPVSESPWAASSDLESYDVLFSPPVIESQTYYIRVAASVNASADGSYGLEVALVGPEPTTGNDCASADLLELPYSSSTAHLFYDDADEDWFAITTSVADAGAQLIVKPHGPWSATSCHVEIFDSCGGNLLLENGSWNGDIRLMGLEAQSSYFIKMSYDTSWVTSQRLYHLDVRVSPLIEAEPNDTCAQALQVSLPLTGTGFAQLSSAADEDWYFFIATAAEVGSALHIDTHFQPRSPGLADTSVQVFAGADCDRLNLIASADSTPNGSNPGQTIGENFTTRNLPFVGPYYIRVAPGMAYGSAGGTEYTLTVDQP